MALSSKYTRGIEIEIGGNATKLKTALDTANRSIRTTQSELDTLQNSLKLEWDPAKFQRAQELAQRACQQTQEKAEMLRKALEGGTGWFQVLVERKARTLRNNLPYAMSEFGCRVVSVGEQQDTQQIALPEGLRTQGNPFEIPRSNAYHAYYYNADTGKFGKVILYKYTKGV